MFVALFKFGLVIAAAMFVGLVVSMFYGSLLGMGAIALTAYLGGSIK